MPVLKRRSASIGQRKKYYSKKQRSHSVSELSVEWVDHNYNSTGSPSALDQHSPDLSHFSLVCVEHNYGQSDIPKPEEDRSPGSDCESDGMDPGTEELKIDNLDFSAGMLVGESVEVEAEEPSNPLVSLDLNAGILVGEKVEVETEKPTNPLESLDLNAGILVRESVEVEAEEPTNPFEILRKDLTGKVASPFFMDYIEKQSTIDIIQLYRKEKHSAVKTSLVIGPDCHVELFVHRTLVPETHDFWSGLSTHVHNGSEVCKILDKLLQYGVCIGNPDPEYHDLTPVGCGISNASSPEILAYREGDFCAVQGTLSYSSTIRSSQCAMLVLGARCSQCSSYRRLLRARKIRQEEKQQKTLSLSSTYKHKDMNRDMLLKKLGQQKEQIKSLQHTIDKMRRDCDKEIVRNGVQLNSIQNQEVGDLMATCEEEIAKAYPDCNSFQRLFWEQQKKAIKHGKNGMRWHPTIIRWCLYLRQKSSKAYDALRDSGFIKLPSSRTLFDYTHYLTSTLGFQPDVVKLLREECEKKEMLQEEWRSYTGILFDEIRIKEDLVYDKHSGEIIGYVKLGDVGDQLCALERNVRGEAENSSVAKCILVLMVRGITSDLKFPFAAFATTGITADFLYPIIWKAVELLETVVKVRVLFLTCDGASANRRFFNLHRVDEDGIVHFTLNPHDRSRKIFFISDVPHLVKTTRNCFSNSHSHSNTRKLWKNGKDISWLHVLRLFEEHCENNLYTTCPKLTRAHLDLTAFSRMKVSLAAQVLSDTVANSLEYLYDDSVSETVIFIRSMNKFFDCLNVRNPFEGRNKRNPNLDPYRSIDDARLEWLKENFLGYLQEWKISVDSRMNLSDSQKASMQLSHQTLNGLKLSTLSITACVAFMLEKGASYILTHCFNQDPLEQHFGHYRHKVGHNNNPTVFEVRNILTQIRTVGALALGPKRGNVQRDENANILNDMNNNKLQRRKPRRL